MVERKPETLAEVIANLGEIIKAERLPGPEPDGVTCHWCGNPCDGTCLGMPLQEDGQGGPVQMKPSDPAYFLLTDGHTTRPQVYREGCYICEDPEFAAMGLPLCEPCPRCTDEYRVENPAEVQGGIAVHRGHIPADDPTCEDCGYDLQAAYESEREAG